MTKPVPPVPRVRGVSRALALALVAPSLGLLGDLGCARKREAPAPAAPAAKSSAPNPGRLPADWLKTEREVPPTAELAKLMARFEADKDDKSRQWILAAVAHLGEPAAVVWLARLAASNQRLDRWAEDALASVKNRHAGLELGDIATSDGPPRVRAAAIQALGASGDLPQAAQLSALVANPQQPLVVRQACASTLGAMGRPGAVPALATALAGAVGDAKMTGQQFRVTLIQALGRIGNDGAREVLQAHARRELSPTERRIVEGALGAPATP